MCLQKFFPLSRSIGGLPNSTLDGGNTNTIEFFLDGNLVDTADGDDIIDSYGFDESGDHVGAPPGKGFAYVALTPAGGKFDKVKLTANGSKAFKFSSAAAVPLPAAAWPMIGGLGALGAYGRRARKKGAAASA